MANTLSVSPLITTNAAGSFQISSTGLIQGTAYGDPAARFALAGGILASTEVLPMWGGVGISEAIPNAAAGNPAVELGALVTRATNLTAAAAGQLTAFTVFDQDHAMMTTPQTPVPIQTSGGLVNFYRLGSGIRIALAIDPALVTLEGGIITQNVSWDFTIQQLCQGQAAYAANVLTGSSWASGGVGGTGTVTFTTTTAHGVQVGSHFTIAGETPTGYNGEYTALTGTTGSTLVAALATNPGAISVEGTLVAGGGFLPIKILDVEIGNSMTVNQPDVNGNISWNRSGSCAVALI